MWLRIREAAADREKLQKELDAMMEEERLKTVKIMEDRDAVRLERLRLQESMIRQQIAERQASLRRDVIDLE